MNNSRQHNCFTRRDERGLAVHLQGIIRDAAEPSVRSEPLLAALDAFVTAYDNPQSRDEVSDTMAELLIEGRKRLAANK